MERFLKIIWAYLRCNLYLLGRLFRLKFDQTEFTEWSKDGKLILLATVSGGALDTLVIEKIFYRNDAVLDPIGDSDALASD